MNDAERLCHDPAMRWIVGGKAAVGVAASPSQMGRFETRWLTADKNLSALADLSGQWIDCVHGRRPPKMIILDMDSSVSPIHGEQEGTAYNGHFGCSCYHPLFLFNQFGDLERCSLRLKANAVLRECSADLLTRPVGRPPNHGRRYYASFSYQAGSWNKRRKLCSLDGGTGV